MRRKLPNLVGLATALLLAGASTGANAAHPLSARFVIRNDSGHTLLRTISSLSVPLDETGQLFNPPLVIERGETVEFRAKPRPGRGLGRYVNAEFGYSPVVLKHKVFSKKPFWTRGYDDYRRIPTPFGYKTTELIFGAFVMSKTLFGHREGNQDSYLTLRVTRERVSKRAHRVTFQGVIERRDPASLT